MGYKTRLALLPVGGERDSDVLNVDASDISAIDARAVSNAEDVFNVSIFLIGGQVVSTSLDLVQLNKLREYYMFPREE